MKTIVEILIDNSNSMGNLKWNQEDFLLPDGTTRMELVKKILVNEIIPSLDYASKINVKTFHSIGHDTDTIKPIIDPVFNAPFDKVTLSEVIENLPIPNNTGGTPITAAIMESIESLVKYDEYDRKIILLTDGEETGNGDYQQAAEQALKVHGIPCEIFVIGIVQAEKAASKARDLAKATKGQYVNIQAKNYTNEYLSSKLHTFKSQLQIGTLNKGETAASVYGSSNITANGIVNGTNNVKAPKPFVVHTPSIKKTASVPVLPNVNPEAVKPDQSTSLKQEGITESDNGIVKENGILSPEGITENTNGKTVVVNTEVTASEELVSTDIEQDSSLPDASEVKQNSISIDNLMKAVIRLQQEVESIKDTKVREEKVVEIGVDDDYEVIEEDVSIEENRLLQEKVGRTSERFVDAYLKVKLVNSNLIHEWMNEEGESGESYDFRIIHKETKYFYYKVECKGTIRGDKVFYLTKNEWKLMIHNPKVYKIYLVTEALSENPKLTIIDNLMTAILRGRVVPYATRNIKLKRDRIVMTIID